MESGRLIGYHFGTPGDDVDRLQRFDSTVHKVFLDKTDSDDTSRPQLREMVNYLRDNDQVVVESLHHLAHSICDLHLIISTITDKNCSVKILDENLKFAQQDQCNGSSLQLLASFARAEKNMLSDTKATKSIQTEPKPRNANPRAKVDSWEETRMKEMIESGVSISGLQEEFNLTRGAVNRIIGSL